MKRIFNWTFALFVFSIPLIPIEYNVKVLILALLFSFFITSFRVKNLLTQSWDSLFYFLILAIGVIYSKDVYNGLGVLESNFSFIAIAIIGSHYKSLSSHRLNLIFFWFLAGVLVACLLCLGYSVFRFVRSGDYAVFFFYEFTRLIGSHPTYLAYYVIISITFILYWLNENKFQRFTRSYLYVVFFVVAFLFFVLSLTGGQTAFTSLLLVCSFFLLKFLLEERTMERRITAGLSCAMILGMFISISLMNGDGKHASRVDSWDRIQLWNAAIKATKNILSGVGTGDYKAALNEYYNSHGLASYAKENYNSHNQFIQIFFSNGLLGLMSILFLLGRPMYLALKCNHVFGILIFFPFIIYGMSEVFLGRYQGIIIFALLHQVFISYYYNYRQFSFPLRS